MELKKHNFTQIFAKSWAEWMVGKPEKIVGAWRHVGISMVGLNPDAIDKTKLVLSKMVAPPQPTPALETTEETTSAITTPTITTPAITTRSVASSSADPITPVLTTVSTPDNWTGVDTDWVAPEPDACTYRTSTDYWKEKARLLEDAARRFRSFALTVHSTPLTLRSTHPDWQPKHVEEPEEEKNGKQRVKGQHGDMDAIEMLEKLDKQVAEEEAAAEGVQQRREDAAERKREREQLAAEKKALKEAQIEFERPLTRLLQRLRFVEENEDEASVKQVAAFVSANKPLLKELQVDLSSTARKTIVPKLVPAIVRTPVSHPWVPAPPKALLPPTATAALMPPPPPPERARSPETTRPASTVNAEVNAASEVMSSAESLADKQPKKKTRAGAAAAKG